MNSRMLAVILTVLTVVFLVLNFSVDGGTVFLILAVASGLAAGYLFTRKG